MPTTWTALSASVQGQLHESLGRPNQDAVRVLPAGDSLMMAVCDGHGSPRSFRSERGANIAAECALRAMRNVVWRCGPDAPLSTLRHQFEHRVPRAIVEDWHRLVRADIAADPFTALDFAAFPDRVPTVKQGEELPFTAYLAYGTTLIFAAVMPRYIAYGQLGDGDILLVWKDGSVSRPWPSDHAFYSTETISLCSSEAELHFTVKLAPLRGEVPALILLATDGYANCFADDNGFFTVGSDLLTYLRAGGVALVQEKLAHWLRESSRDGSRDDITVAMAGRLWALDPRLTPRSLDA